MLPAFCTEFSTLPYLRYLFNNPKIQGKAV
jgi:hypothetical protein